LPVLGLGLGGVTATAQPIAAGGDKS